MCFLLKHNIGDSIVHLNGFIDHYVDDIKTIHHTVLVRWLLTGFWILAMHYVTSHGIMTSYCEVTWPHDVTLWCYMTSHHRHNMIHWNERCCMWFTNTLESVLARCRKRSRSSRRTSVIRSDNNRGHEQSSLSPNNLPLIPNITKI